MSADEEQEFRDFFERGIETINGQHHRIKQLEAQVKDLEGRDCRFTCRVRVDEMWKEGFRWGFVRAQKLSVPDVDQEFKRWGNRNDKI